MTKHLIIPDVQVKPDENLDHLTWAAKYTIDQKPDVVICLGDFADMESLSSYDIGKKSFEGRRYTKDIEAASIAMDLYMKPIKEEIARLKNNKKKQWNPRFVLTLGNHCHRIVRACEDDPKLDGLIKMEDLPYDDWEVHPFLSPVVIDGICYSHYQCSGAMGRPITSARALLTKKFMSCVVGHQQGRDIAYAVRGDGHRMFGLIVGSYYQHDEPYLNHQTNNHWRGLVVLHEVEDGSADEMFVSIDYLKRKYG